MIKFFKLFLCCYFVVLSSSALSESAGCEGVGSDCLAAGEWQFSLAMGWGTRSNPVQGGDDQPIVVMPNISYYGKRLFIENFSLGYLLAATPRHEWSLMAGIGFEHVFFHELSIGNFSLGDGLSGGSAPASGAGGLMLGGSVSPASDGQHLEESGRANQPQQRLSVDVDDLERRDAALMGGLDYRFYAKPFYVSVQALRDISSVHDGSELKMAGTLEWGHGRNMSAFSLGAYWQNAYLLNYYYGVHLDDVSGENSLVYKADAGWSPFFRLDHSYFLNKRWRLKAALSVRQLAPSVADSPIVEEDYVLSAFLGGVYHF